MDDSKGFYTLKGYQRNTTDNLTASMEDYLEMICRIAENESVVRMHEIAERLHVKASSVSKMVNNLKQAGYIDFHKYGYIVITEKGYEMGRYLLYRHKVLHDFLCRLNGSDNELEQVEKIEHFINKDTIINLEKLNNKLIW